MPSRLIINISRAIALRLEHTYLHVQVVDMIAAKHSDGGSVLTAAVSSGNEEIFTAVMELLDRSVTGGQVPCLKSREEASFLE